MVISPFIVAHIDCTALTYLLAQMFWMDYNKLKPHSVSVSGIKVKSTETGNTLMRPLFSFEKLTAKQCFHDRVNGGKAAA